MPASDWKRQSIANTIPPLPLWERIKEVFRPRARTFVFSVYIKGEAFLDSAQIEERTS